MKSIETLIPDIYALMGSGATVDQAALDHLGKAMAVHVANALAGREVRGELRGSSIGTQCDRKLWYMTNEPEEGEDPAPYTKIKFLYGHLLEELVLFLAEQAGHKVEARQQKVTVNGVDGHLDAVIDGRVVDAKSANSRSMEKFRNNSLQTDDPFGYLDQINFYHAGYTGSKDDKVSFLAIDKELGHLVLDTYPAYGADVVKNIIDTKKELIKGDIPARGYMPEADGKSGNMQLCMECRYCDRKNKCWPGLRTFLYAGGPRFLTRVVREPDVPELHHNHDKKEKEAGNKTAQKGTVQK